MKVEIEVNKKQISSLIDFIKKYKSNEGGRTILFLNDIVSSIYDGITKTESEIDMIREKLEEFITFDYEGDFIENYPEAFELIDSIVAKEYDGMER